MATVLTERKFHGSFFLGGNDHQQLMSRLNSCNMQSASGRQTAISSVPTPEQTPINGNFRESCMKQRTKFDTDRGRLCKITMATASSGDARRTTTASDCHHSNGKGNSCCGVEVLTASEASQTPARASLLRKRGLEGILSTLEQRDSSRRAEKSSSTQPPSVTSTTTTGSKEKEQHQLQRHLNVPTCTATVSDCLLQRNPLVRAEETSYHHCSSDIRCGIDRVHRCSNRLSCSGAAAADALLFQVPTTTTASVLSDSDSSETRRLSSSVDGKLIFSGKDNTGRSFTSDFLSADSSLKDRSNQRELQSRVNICEDHSNNSGISSSSRDFSEFFEGGNACWPQPEPGLRKLDLANHGLRKFMSPQDNLLQIDGITSNTSPESSQYHNSNGSGFVSSPDNTTSSYAATAAAAGGFELEAGCGSSDSYNLTAHRDLNHHSSVSSTSVSSLQNFPPPIVDNSYVPASEMNTTGAAAVGAIDSFPSVQQQQPPSSASLVDTIVPKMENGGSGSNAMSGSSDSSSKAKMNKIFPWMHGSRQSGKKNQDSTKDDNSEGMFICIYFA